MATHRISDWRWALRILAPLIVFSAGIGAVSLLVLHPLTVALSQALVARAGEPFAGNFDLLPFLLSPAGMMTALVLTGSAIFLRALEFGGLTLIAWDGRCGRPPALLRGAYRLASRLPSLLALTGIAFAVGALLLIPVGAAAWMAKALWLGGGDIYFYVTTQPPEFFYAVVLVGTVAACALAAGVMLVLRWFLAVPFAVIGGLSAVEALRRSAAATRGRRLKLLVRLAVIGAAVFAVAALASFAFTALFDTLFNPAHPMRAGARALLILAIAAGVLTTLTAGLARAAFAVLGAGLYADAGTEERFSEIVPEGAESGLWIVCGVLAFVAAAQIVWAFEEFDIDGPLYVTAHRAGSSAAPENTLPALERAIADGADFAEVDVQETSDGQVIVVHDTDFRRVAGVARPVWEMSFDEVRQLDAGSWFGPEFRGTIIPQLGEFARAAKGRIRLNVEVKNNGHGQDLAARTIRILSEEGVLNDAVITSLDLGLLAQVRKLDSDIKTGFIASTGLGNMLAVDVDFYSLAIRIATPAAIRRIADTDRTVHVWGAGNETAITDAILAGATNVIVDDPAAAKRTVTALLEMTAPEVAFLRMRRLFERQGLLNRPR